MHEDTTRIYSCNILKEKSDWFVNAILAYRKYIDPLGKITTNVGGWQSPYFVNQEFPFKAFAEYYFDVLFQYYRAYMIEMHNPTHKEQVDGILLYDSWFTVSDKGDFNHPHHHSPPRYYHKYTCSLVHFLKISDDSGFYITNENSNDKYYPPVKEGDLMIFDCKTFHGVDENPFDEPRITVVFNMEYIDETSRQ